MKYPHSASISRLHSSGGKYVFASAGSSICFLQPIDETSAQLFGLTWTKGFVCYFPVGADVKESDSLTIKSVKYGVRGISTRDYGSSMLQHKKAVLEKL